MAAIGVEGHRLPALALPIQRYARLAGLLFLISLVAGGFGEWYVPSRLIVPGDAAATARNFIASDWLFRLGLAGYLMEAICDIGLTLIFYIMLKPVSRNLALLMVFFRLMGTGLFAVAEIFYFAPRLILSRADYLKAFAPDQLNSLALLSLKMYGSAAGIFMVFFGAGSLLIGYLIWRSGFLPRLLGGLMALGGTGFVIGNFVLVLAPRYASPLLFLPTVLAALFLMAWLLTRGVDTAKWGEMAAKAA